MGDNLPPGVSAGHPHFNPPDMEHEHRFEPVEDMYPVFEDGAAILVEECIYEHPLKTEKGYEGARIVTESILCEEQRQIRFEPISILNLETDELYRTAYDEFEDGAGNYVLPVEEALHDVEMKDPDIESIDPDSDRGHVVARVSGYRIVYQSTAQSNRRGE